MSEATIRAQVEKVERLLGAGIWPITTTTMELRHLLADLDRLTRELAHEEQRVADMMADVNRVGHENDRLTRELAEAREESEAVRFANVEGKMWVDNAVHDIRRLSSAIRWALGYDEGDPQFGEQAEQKGAFAWRAELRRRAGDALAQIEKESK